MKSLKLLYCGCLISLLGCAGSEPVAKQRSVNADEIRAKSAQAFNEIDQKPTPAVQSSVKNDAPSAVQPQVQVKVAEEPKGMLSEWLQSYTCPNADDLRGVGIDENASAALTLAQKEIAARIQSVVIAQTEQTRQSNVDAAGNESIKSSFEAKTQVITRLQNAQDAKPVVTLTKGGKYGVVACMQRADAAKPFVKEAGLLQDSVMLAAKIFEEQKHPIVKNNAFKTVRDIYVRSLAVDDILAGLGVKPETQTKSIYDTVLHEYNMFRSQFAFYYQEDGNADASVAPQRRLVFERISSRYPVRMAECSNGLMLKLQVSPIDCIEKSLGLSCSANLTLSGSNCEGESYFNINAKVKGSGRYESNETIERLNENISSGDWFGDWIPELDKWRLE